MTMQFPTVQAPDYSGQMNALLGAAKYLIGGGGTTTSTTSNSNTAPLMSGIDLAMSNATDEDKTNALVQSILDNAGNTFGQQYGQMDNSTGIYNSTALAMMRAHAAGAATAQSAQAVLNYQTSQQQVAASQANTVAEVTSKNTASKQTATGATSGILQQILGLASAAVAGKGLYNNLTKDTSTDKNGNQMGTTSRKYNDSDPTNPSGIPSGTDNGPTTTPDGFQIGAGDGGTYGVPAGLAGIPAGPAGGGDSPGILSNIFSGIGDNVGAAYSGILGSLGFGNSGGDSGTQSQTVQINSPTIPPINTPIYDAGSGSDSGTSGSSGSGGDNYNTPTITTDNTYTSDTTDNWDWGDWGDW